MKVIRESKAFEEIGWDDGPIRIKGGKVIYDAVMFRSDTRGEKVLLCRLEVKDGRIHQVNRWVDPDTTIEFLEE